MAKNILFSILLIISGFNTNAQRYIFSLHGKIVEDQGRNAFDSVHGYGAYDYEAIIAAFKKEKFIVITEYRKPNTNVKDYAHKVAGQIDSLLKTGVKASAISVIGASKGALIAILTSSYLKNPNVNFVFMSACNDYLLEDKEINFCGNILSIYEKSDPGCQTCEKIKRKSTLEMPHYKEIELNTGLKHGYIYKPRPEWVVPALKWAGGKYE